MLLGYPCHIVDQHGFAIWNCFNHLAAANCRTAKYVYDDVHLLFLIVVEFLNIQGI